MSKEIYKARLVKLNGAFPLGNPEIFRQGNDDFAFYEEGNRHDNPISEYRTNYAGILMSMAQARPDLDEFEMVIRGGGEGIAGEVDNDDKDDRP
jgi:hypothetical protein